jgi:hypothetical protein
MPELGWLLDAGRTFGIPTVLFAIIIWAGSGDHPRWVFGSYHRERLHDRDREQGKRDDLHAEIVESLRGDIANHRGETESWKRAFLELAPVAKAAVEHAEKVTKDL